MVVVVVVALVVVTVMVVVVVVVVVLVVVRPSAGWPPGWLAWPAWLRDGPAVAKGAARTPLCFKMYKCPYNLPPLPRGLLLMYFTT